MKNANPEKLLNIAIKLIENNQFELATKALKNSQIEFPKEFKFTNLLAQISLRENNLDKGINFLMQSLQINPNQALAMFDLGIAHTLKNQLNEALLFFDKSIQLEPDNQKAHIRKGVTCIKLGRVEESISSFKQAIKINPNHAEAYFNLGNIFYTAGKLEDAEVSYKQVINIDPEYAEAYNNLGSVFYTVGKLEDAEVSYKQAIKINSGYADAYNNLGNTLHELEKLKDAEVSYKQVIKINPDYAQAYSKLGMVLKDKGELEAALEFSKKAIILNPKLSELNFNMGIIFYASSNINSALESLKIANSIDPHSKKIKLVLNFLQQRKKLSKYELNNINQGGLNLNSKLNLNPLILNRDVEKELIPNLYEMSSKDLNKTNTDDPRYGNGRCSPDFNMYEENNPIIKTVVDDLMNIIKLAVKSEVFVYDSFFNILGTGGGVGPHRHLNSLDKDKSLGFENNKYSLVYYLSVGDQTSKEPGILKLYDPDKEILPSDGMVIIFPAKQKHSAVYDGKKDRIIIGINFYSI